MYKAAGARGPAVPDAAADAGGPDGGAGRLRGRPKKDDVVDAEFRPL